MPLTPDIAEQVLSACRQNASGIAAAISQTCNLPLEISPEKIETFNYTGTAPEWSGPGLVFVFKLGDEAAMVLLAASSGLVPDWTKSPTAADQIKLTALAQELGNVLLPANHTPDDFSVAYVESLEDAVLRGQIADEAGAIHLVAKSGDNPTALRMIWPATRPGAIFMADPEPVEELSPVVQAPRVKRAAEVEQDLVDHIDRLPSYIRSLLRISVPVSVHLATVRLPVSRVLNIGPGSIIQFEKNCERPLTLCIGNQPVAEGDAVKVGEKFGIKLTSMVLPGERFTALRGARKQGSG